MIQFKIDLRLDFKIIKLQFLPFYSSYVFLLLFEYKFRKKRRLM